MVHEKHGRRAARLFAGSLGVVLLIGLIAAIVGGPVARPPRQPGLRSQNESLETQPSGDAPACTPVMSGECSTGTKTTGPAATTDCNLVEQILDGCSTSTTTTVPRTTTSSPLAPSTAPSPTPPTSPPSPRSPASNSDAGNGGGGCAGTSPPIAPPTGPWTCTLDDEFNGTSLNPSLWQPVLTSTSDYQSGTLFSQVCYVNDPGTISESGGVLHLSVVQAPSSTTCQQPGGMSFITNYEGGMISSYQLFSQKYGYFEARAAVPPTSVPGLQETLWLFPEDETLYGPWPDSGEIDYGEFYSSYPLDDVPDVHYPGSGGDPNATTPTGCSIAGDATAGRFNTYALSWTPTTITTYFNGVPCTTDTYAPFVTSPDAAPAPFNQPFFLAFTAALSGDGDDSFQPGTTPLPATTQIDWVRAWQY